MIRLSMLACAALGLAALVTTPAQAQFGRGFRLPSAVQNIFLLRGEAVQKELDLDKEQVAAITALAGQMQTEAMEIMSGLQDLTEEERKEEMPNLMKMISEKGKELQGKVDKTLKPKQTARLKELSIQRRNPGALQDDEVVAVLKLTDDQKKQLDAIRDEAGKEQEAIRRSSLRRRRRRPHGDREPSSRPCKRSIGDKALAVLTAEQREQFEKMKGEKFTFPAAAADSDFRTSILFFETAGSSRWVLTCDEMPTARCGGGVSR